MENQNGSSYTEVDISLNLEDLYKVISGLSFTAAWLEKPGTDFAHTTTALEYRKLMNRFDQEFQKLYFRENPEKREEFRVTYEFPATVLNSTK